MRPGLIELDDNYILLSVLLFIWLTYLWETYLTLRQRSIYTNAKNVPSEVESVMDQDTFDKSRRYQLDKTNFGLIHGVVSQLETTLILVLGGLPFLWRISGNIQESYGYPSEEYEILHSIVFSIIGAIFGTVTNMPWNVYSTFVIEQKHGFNKQTASFFIKDQIKSFFIFQTISLVITAGLIYIVKVGGDYFFLYCWFFVIAVSLVMITIYPDYIAPLFDKFTPLPEGELKTAIEKLATTINFPLTKLYVVEGSKRSSHSNAYFYGFFKNKRIVLFDTLLESYTPAKEESDKPEEKTAEETQEKAVEEEPSEDKKEEPKKGCTDEEVVAVLSHELGHWYLNHVLKNFFIGQTNILICFAAFAYLLKYSQLYTAFGFYAEQPVLIGLLIIFSYIFAPYNEVVSFLMTMMSRRFEFQADAFSANLGYSRLLQTSLIKLQKDNLGFPVVDWLYSTWSYSHPPLLERLAAIRAQSTKQD